MSFISLMEIIGTVAFAVSGALVAIEKKLDYYGIVFLAIITAVGGGIIRDLMINLPLPVALANPLYVIISVATAIAVIVFYRWVTKLQILVTIFDAIGLAAFTAIGAQSAVSNDVFTPFVVITLALLTGTGGGILRDVFAREVPFVFRKEVYAVASIAGAVAFLAAYSYTGIRVAMYICFGVTLVIRLVSVKFNWHLAKVKTGAITHGSKRKKEER
ncbi:MAG: trimeric intracellular cation channel family protein [Bacillota bacterium]|nr:trimeric intracellular cation channel family protein [Bacillota bacterium]